MTRSMKLSLCAGLATLALGVGGPAVIAAVQPGSISPGVIGPQWTALSTEEKIEWLKSAYEDEHNRAERLAIKDAALEKRIQALEDRPIGTSAHCNTLTTVRDLKQNAGYDPFMICLSHP